MKSRFRSGVVGVFTNPEGLVLVGERSNTPGCWQFPQGGVDPGEDHDAAVLREMDEEVGCSQFSILRKGEGTTTYEFPVGLGVERTRKFVGQQHQWYLLQFAEGAGPDVSKCDGEFLRFEWITPAEALKRIIFWKRDAYVQGMQSLGLPAIKG